MICILFGIKIDPYFHNLGLLYENLKRHSFYDVFQMTSPSEFSKQKDQKSQLSFKRLTLHMTFSPYYDFSMRLCKYWASLPPTFQLFLLITSQVGRNIREAHLFENVVIFSHPYLDINVRLFKMLHNVDIGSQF